MIIFLYLILVLAWALLIIILKCKKARAKRLAELQEASQPVHVVQIGSNLYDIMSIQHHHHLHPRAAPYGTMYDCLGAGGDYHQHGGNTAGNTGSAAATAAGRPPLTTSVTHSNAAFVGDDGSVYPGSHISPLEPPPSYDEVIRLPAHYPKVETFVPEMVVPPPPPPPIGDDPQPHHHHHHHHPSAAAVAPMTATNPAVAAATGNRSGSETAASVVASSGPGGIGGAARIKPIIATVSSSPSVMN